MLEVQDLHMYYTTKAGDVKAVDGIDFSIAEGDVFGVVGESGCGKSSLALALLKLLPSNAKILSGKIVIGGDDITGMPDAFVRRRIRWTKIAMVPQGAMNALNPVFRVEDQMTETLRVHSDISKADARAKVMELLKLVGLDETKGRLYPHELSGGMKQRVMIAMSLLLNPVILIADEPTTALDVVVQAGIIRLLVQVSKELGTSVILISHDLALVAQMSTKVAIMYAGKFVEFGTSRDVYKSPFHPYTIGLLGAFADIRRAKEKLISVPGSPPDLIDPPSGCRFHPRCSYARDLCKQKEPPLEKAAPGHLVACHFWEKIREGRTQ